MTLVRSKRSFFAAAAIVGIITIAIWISWVPEPYYQGQRESFWINSLGNGNWPPPGWKELSTNVVPILTKAMGRRDGRLHTAYIALYGRLPSWLKCQIPQPVSGRLCRENAGLRLMDMGDKASEAIPALIVLMKGDRDSHVRGLAAACLGHIGSGDKTVASALAEAAVRDKDSQVRTVAAGALKLVGPRNGE
jgi:hypothetical protein